MKTPAASAPADAWIELTGTAYDGDTLHARIPALPPPFDRRNIRLGGIDMPERQKPKCVSEREAANKAAEFVCRRLAAAETFRIEPVEWGKYGRVVAKVFLDGENLSDALIEAGLAHPTSGGGWCDTAR